MWKIEKVVSKGDYEYAVVRNHPGANKHGYVLHHRVVMENHLCRVLNPGEVIHHKNGNKKDNTINNLELMDNAKHSRMHGLEQGRMWCTLKCPSCGKLFDKPKNRTFLNKPAEYTACSRICSGKLGKLIQVVGRTHEVERAISENLVSEYKVYSNDNPEETH
jgi:hypothetical protein